MPMGPSHNALLPVAKCPFTGRIMVMGQQISRNTTICADSEEWHFLRFEWCGGGGAPSLSIRTFSFPIFSHFSLCLCLFLPLQFPLWPFLLTFHKTQIGPPTGGGKSEISHFPIEIEVWGHRKWALKFTLQRHFSWEFCLCLRRKWF